MMIYACSRHETQLQHSTATQTLNNEVVSLRDELPRARGHWRASEKLSPSDEKWGEEWLALHELLVTCHPLSR